MIGSQRDTNPAIINFGLSSSVFQEPQMSLISKALGILSVQNEKTKFTQNSKLAILKLPFRNFDYIMLKMSWVRPLYLQVRVAQFIADEIFQVFRKNDLYRIYRFIVNILSISCMSLTIKFLR